MTRTVKIGTCQPPAPTSDLAADHIQSRALDLLAQAGNDGVDICCLPECLNVMGCGFESASRRASEVDGLITQVADVCSRCRMYAVLPVIERRDGRLYNTAIVLGRDGHTVGRYDKVHLTRDERDNWALTPGHTYPVFELDFGKVGVMICYDGCFPEPARILALQGAEVVFFPALQRSYPEDHLALQARARAADNFLYIVRSSYGTDRTDVWRPGRMVGKSCIVAPDGTIVADLGKYVGVTAASLDLHWPVRGQRSHAGEIGDLRQMRFQDRRPETYGRLVQAP